MPKTARLLFALLFRDFDLFANCSLAGEKVVLLTEHGGVDGCERFFSPGVDPCREEAESTTDWMVKPRQLTGEARTLFTEE